MSSFLHTPTDFPASAFRAKVAPPPSHGFHFSLHSATRTFVLEEPEMITMKEEKALLTGGRRGRSEGGAGGSQ